MTTGQKNWTAKLKWKAIINFDGLSHFLSSQFAINVLGG